MDDMVEMREKRLNHVIIFSIKNRRIIEASTKYL